MNLLGTLYLTGTDMLGAQHLDTGSEDTIYSNKKVKYRVSEPIGRHIFLSEKSTGNDTVYHHPKHGRQHCYDHDYHGPSEHLFYYAVIH